MQNLTVHAVDADKGLVLIIGAVPGPKGGVVLIKSAVKNQQQGGCLMTTVQITTPGRRGRAAPSSCPADIFDVTANVPLMHQVVVAQLAAARQGTHKAKTRGEVSGGGKKPYRQKGTGRARQGSTRAPQFNGGGIVHGPVPHGYTQRTPKKMKAAALRGALSDRARGGNVHVLSTLRDRRHPVHQDRDRRAEGRVQRQEHPRGAQRRGRRSAGRACATSPRCT